MLCARLSKSLPPARDRQNKLVLKLAAASSFGVRDTVGQKMRGSPGTSHGPAGKEFEQKAETGGGARLQLFAPQR